MIRRLTLRNWRNYEDVTVDFGVGTTFVVASNGVGKTSLVEAARWALFGKPASGGNAAVRAGAGSAVAIVELELPDLRVLAVERTLAAKARRAEPAPVVRLDGALVPPEQLDQQLIRAYGSEPGFLANLTMPPVGQGSDNPSALGLEEHLGRYYGVDDLRIAVGELKTMQKTNERRIKQIKNANSTTSRRLAELQSGVEQAALLVAKATEAHKVAQSRVDRARVRERIDADMQRWQENHATWAEAVERVAEQVSIDLGRPIAVESVESALDERLADLDQQIEAVRIEIAVSMAKEASLAANEERLDTAHDDCPVCRRPLDDATVAFAHEANSQERSAIHGSIVELRGIETSLDAQRELVKAAQTDWRQIPQPGVPPQTLAADDDEPVAAAELTVMAETTLNALVEARAANVQATKELGGAQAANEAMRELETLFRQQANLRVASEATEATLTELLNETIRPLAAEVDQRWKSLFPDRGDLNTSSDGNITRMVNGHRLSFDSFSTGESMGATILLRLLVAQMVTTAGFCWFDEPLEHLDPDVRRKVASMLSRVTGGEGPLRQVVVTTYEEPLARHLQARDKQHVTLLDVRQAS